MSALALSAPDAECVIAGVTGLATPEGGLYLPADRVLIVADLHLEKGSAQAVRGYPVPPYDTAATMAALEAAVRRHAPRVVVALGDSFHDVGGPARLDAAARQGLCDLAHGRDLLWITGNHDPVITDVPGEVAHEIVLGPLTLRHEPSRGEAPGEIAGHLHPAAKLMTGARNVRRKCLASDGRRAVLPAFGAYAGGLSIRDRALASLFDWRTLVLFMLSDGRVYPVPGRRCG